MSMGMIVSLVVVFCNPLRYWKTVQSVPCFHPVTTGNKHQLLTALHRKVDKENGWMKDKDLFSFFNSQSLLHANTLKTGKVRPQKHTFSASFAPPVCR